MKKYDCYILSNNEVEHICGKPVEFHKGFMTGNVAGTPDWLNMLQKHIGQPIVSIREVNRELWNEVLVLCSDGYLVEDKPVIRGTIDYIEDVLNDIFMEAENDEYEVFDSLQFDITDGSYDELHKYVHEIW